MFSGGKTVPCVNDTADDDSMDVDEGSCSGSGTPTRLDTTHTTRTSVEDEEASYDQGIRDAWFPPNTSLSTECGGDRVVVTVPPGVDNLRVREDTEEFTYVKVTKTRTTGEDDSISDGEVRRMGSEAEARSKRQPGTYHDRDTCPGCIAREQALLDARIAAEAEDDANLSDQDIHNSDAETSDADSDFSSSSIDSMDSDLPPYVPSPQTIPPCDGVRDVLVTGTTDPRHAAAWGNWIWRGRVRTWDGLVGFVRSAELGVSILSLSLILLLLHRWNTNKLLSQPSTSGIPNAGGKIFFYGTLLGGRNLVGTWRLAHEDPRMPAYEGAFTLGRKDDE